MSLLDTELLLAKKQVGNIVKKRINEFKQNGRSDNSMFIELCFCILTANFSAERAIRIQKKLGNGFFLLNKKILSKKLRVLGHRFPNVRAGFIANARVHKKGLKKRIFSFENGFVARDWLVSNVKGLGLKESSHFLRNIGFSDVAIIDFHIMDLLQRHGLHKKTVSLTRKKYFEAECVLKKIAERNKLSLAELDLYLWFIETGKVLK
jgi:N-glycosylase/DNA lyase